MCGCLLYAGANSMGNFCYGPSVWAAELRGATPCHARSICMRRLRPGPPMNRDGQLLIDAGIPRTDAQPPCLLRYSPKLFATECPTMFAYDELTNTLSLQPGRHPPWIRKTAEHERIFIRESTKTWCYCPECKGRWCSDTAQRSKAFVPFRDRASQLNMRPHARPQAVPSGGGAEASQNTQPEPEPEEEGADAFRGDVEMPADEDELEAPEEPVILPTQGHVPDAPDPEAYPTLEEYRERWAARLAAPARPTGGEYSLADLVPKAVPNLWNDCPMVPFDTLISEEAQSMLSVCRPMSAFTASTMKEGVPRYSLPGALSRKHLASSSCTSVAPAVLSTTGQLRT